MTITLEKIKYQNFDDEQNYFHVFCIETKTKENIDRSFIVFEHDSNLELDSLMIAIKNNKNAIHEAIGNMDKIQKIIGVNDIKITAYTNLYWEDVRLYSDSSRFNYAEDVYNTSIIDMNLNKLIRNKFYNKEILIGNCNEGNIEKIIHTLNQSKFKEEELKEVFQENPNVKHFFDLHSLHNLLVKNLTINNDKFKKNKI
jgi:hypothetical protein